MKLPRFNLRDLFWLTLVVAMACGWWLDRAGPERAQTIGTLIVVMVLFFAGYLLGRQTIAAERGPET